jgi:hypothetical protein
MCIPLATAQCPAVCSYLDSFGSTGTGTFVRGNCPVHCSTKLNRAGKSLVCIRIPSVPMQWPYMYPGRYLPELEQIEFGPLCIFARFTSIIRRISLGLRDSRSAMLCSRALKHRVLNNHNICGNTVRCLWSFHIEPCQQRSKCSVQERPNRYPVFDRGMCI